MECLVYAHERGCPWDDTVCAASVRGGSLQCLRYAHEHGCSWSERTLSAAAKAGNLMCLMYAHEHGCPYDLAAICSSSQRFKHGLTPAAVQRVIGLPCLKYVHKGMGCRWDPKGMEWMHAFHAGRCDVLKYIHQHGGPWWGDMEEFEEKMTRSLDYCGPAEMLDRRARCFLYMHRYGGCKLPPLGGTKVGERVAIMRERTAAVLLCFRAAG